MYEEKIAVDEYYGSGDGESYCSYIDDKLSELGNILWKCTGITTDGASNMTGDYKGLQSRLRAKVEEQLNLRRMDLLLMFIAFYCMPHRHNLCIEKFCELELVMLLLDVATWLGSNKADSWRQFAKRNNINTIPKNVIQDGRTVMMLSITYSLIMIQSISSSLNMNWEVTLVPI